MDLVEKQQFTVQPFEVDFRGRITFPLLFNNLLNAAGHHADKRGFGILQIKDQGKTWVLSRIAIDIERMPIAEESITVETWIENVMRSFSFRNFAIIGGDGKVIGYARSIWAMIDNESRKPESLEKTGILDYLHPEKECPVAKIGKIVIPEEIQEADSFTVKFSDLDINKHLNSAKYLEHIFDIFSLEELGERNVQKFEIEYVEECRFGSKIIIYKGETNKEQTSILLKNEEDKIVCKCKISWR